MIGVLLLSHGHLVQAGPVTFEREYEYRASELDSKLSCRTIALQQVKKLLLEEVGTYLTAETEVKNYQLVREEIIALSAGIVGTEVVGEQWDGQTYKLKAKLSVDTDHLIKSLNSARNNYEQRKDLENARRQADNLLAEVQRLQNELKIMKGKKKLDKKNAYEKAIQGLNAFDYYQKAWELYDQSKTTEAIDALNKAIVIDPKNAALYASRGHFQHRLGEFDLARKDYDLAVKYDPQNSDMYLRRGMFYSIGIGSFNFEKALADFDMAISKDSNSSRAYSGRALLLSGLSLDKDDYDSLVYLNFFGGKLDYKNALADSDRAIDLEPGYAMAYAIRAYALYMLGQGERAERDLLKARSLDQLIMPFIIIARVYEKLGNYLKVAESYTDMIAKQPDLYEGYYRRAKAYKQLRYYAKAIADYDFYLSSEKRNVVAYAYIERADCYYFSGNYQKAIEESTNIIKNKYPLPVRFAFLAYQRRADSYREVGLHDLAIADYDEMLKYWPENTESYYGKGMSLVLSKRNREAIAVFDKGIAKNPTDDRLYFGRGGANLELGNYEAGFADLRIAEKLGNNLAKEYLKYLAEKNFR